MSDGSSDRTAEVAARAGVTEVVRFPNHQGLARASPGLERALQLGADVMSHRRRIILGADIPGAHRPIRPAREADIVIGTASRDPAHFQLAEGMLQRIGTGGTAALTARAVTGRDERLPRLQPVPAAR